MDKQFKCDQCGDTKAPVSIGTGYGVDKDGRKICYECCGINDAKALASANVGDKFTHYLVGDLALLQRSKSQDKKALAVVNWPSSLTIPVFYARLGRHNIAGERLTVWFSFEGKNFVGVRYGKDSEICYIRRIK